jgi:hypothetical protein
MSEQNSPEDARTGRARRNTRPRDSLGRPLPYGSPGTPTMPEGVRRTPELALATAQQLLDDGLPFHAHEILEDAWKSAPAGERAVWRALAQLAVGATHAARGNRDGAIALLSRAARELGRYPADNPYRIDVEGLQRWAARAIATMPDAPLPLDAPQLVIGTRRLHRDAGGARSSRRDRLSTRGAVHHIELWVNDLAAAEASFGWLFLTLGYQLADSWPNGRSWRLNDTYIVVESGPAVAAEDHDRLRPGLNHLALQAGTRRELDSMVTEAAGHGWSLLFTDRHPYAGGPQHYAAYLENADGFEVELVAGNES